MGHFEPTKPDLLSLAQSAIEADFAIERTRWQGLDTKAQGTATVAGVFLAGTFTWTSKLPQDISTLQALCLLTVACAVAGAKLCAVLAMKVRGQHGLLPSDRVVSSVRDYLSFERTHPDSPDALSELFETLYSGAPQMLEELRASTTAKANHLARAQGLLLTAAVAGLLLIATTVFPHLTL